MFDNYYDAYEALQTISVIPSGSQSHLNCILSSVIYSS